MVSFFSTQCGRLKALLLFHESSIIELAFFIQFLVI